MADHLTKNVRGAITKLHEHAAELGDKKLRSLIENLDRQLGSMVPAEGGEDMRVESMVASGSKNPEIVFIWGKNKGQLPVVAAKGYALQILEVCEAAIQDASLFRAFTTDLAKGKDPEEQEKMAFAVINLVRKNRAHFEQGGE